MSAMRQKVSMKRLCVRCMVIGEDIISSVLTSERSVRKTKLLRSGFLKIPSNNTEGVEDVNGERQKKESNYGQEWLSKKSLSKCLSFLEIVMKLRRVREVSCYSVFLFKLIHNLHPGIFN